MIPLNEFREKARLGEVPITTIERDYAQNWLLVHLPDMAFKGGTGLRKIFIGGYRFSDDLDFTLVENTTFRKLKKEIVKAVNTVRDVSGVNFLDEIRSEEVRNGYVFAVYFRILRTTGDPLKIKIDITKQENEIIIKPLQRKKIIHSYSDNLDKQIMVYSLDEIFVEKVRSLFERTRPRDLYDVWYLSKNKKIDKSMLEKKCEVRDIVLNVDNVDDRKTKFVNSWENSLRHQLKEMPSADKVFCDVIEFLKTNI